MDIQDFIERQGQKLFRGFGALWSRPAGGSSAALAGQRACSSDGPVDPAESDARRLTLVPVSEFEGSGWYLRCIDGSYSVVYLGEYDLIFKRGSWWKIQE